MSRATPKVQTTRQADVIVPVDVIVPRVAELVPVLGELPEAHDHRRPFVRSRRGHARAHWRLEVTRPPLATKTAKVHIPVVSRRFPAFYTQWRAVPGKRILLAHHYKPEVKIDRQLNRPMRDWKHVTRSDPDSSRANSIAALGERVEPLFDALASGNPQLAADSAIVIYNTRR